MLLQALFDFSTLSVACNIKTDSNIPTTNQYKTPPCTVPLNVKTCITAHTAAITVDTTVAIMDHHHTVHMDHHHPVVPVVVTYLAVYFVS